MAALAAASFMAEILSLMPFGYIVYLARVVRHYRYPTTTAVVPVANTLAGWTLSCCPTATVPKLTDAPLRFSKAKVPAVITYNALTPIVEVTSLAVIATKFDDALSFADSLSPILCSYAYFDCYIMD